MAIRKFTVNLTTDSGGACTAYTPYLSGYINAIQYVKTDFADGVDFTITADTTGESILALTDQNTAVKVFPRTATHTTVGVASLYAAAGTAVTTRIALGADRVKIVIAQGGNVKTGSVVVTVDDPK
jgi:hypothetical protein